MPQAIPTQFTIKLNELLFNKMKNASTGSCFITNRFYNNNFNLRIFPNGIYGNLASYGNVLKMHILLKIM